MVLPAQQSVIASLALRFNREDVLGWIEAKPAMTLGFESEAQRLASELTPKSSDADIIKALVQLFSATNFNSIAVHYGEDTAINMSCTDEEIEGLDSIVANNVEEASKDPNYMAKLALNQYISVAMADLEREPVQALIDTTSQPQYLMWFANLRYQACDFDEFEDSAFAKFFNHVAGNVDIGKPEFADCEWSLDRI